MLAYLARLVTEIAIQSGLAPLEVLEQGADGVCRDRKLRFARAVLAQLTEDMDRDGRGRAHGLRRSLSLAIKMMQGGHESLFLTSALAALGCNAAP